MKPYFNDAHAAWMRGAALDMPSTAGYRLYAISCEYQQTETCTYSASDE
jgi:hypothetical protein